MLRRWLLILSRCIRPEIAGTRIVAALLLSACTVAAHAQVLEFDEPLTPPELDRFTYANHLIGDLEREIAQHLANERGADPLEKLTLQAMVNVRVMAADLLSTGDRAGKDGCITLLAGLTLAQGRDAVDASLHNAVAFGKRIATAPQVSADDQQRLREIIESLRLFNEKAVTNAQDIRTTDVAQLDRAVAALLTPLGDAISAIERTPIENHWIASSMVKPTPAMTMVRLPGVNPAIGPTIRTLAQARADLASMSLREDTKVELDGIIDFLERGSAFPDLRPQVEASLRHISQVIDLLTSLANADWLDDVSRDAYLDRLHLGVVLFKDPRTRERGQRHLDRLESSRIIIDRITGLAQAKVPIRAVRSAFLTADAMIEDPAQAELGQEQLRKLEIVLARMLTYRDLGQADLRRDLQLVERQLDQNYREAEAHLLEEIDTLTTRPGALADPAFASLMQDQDNYLSDIQRVRRLPEWVDTMRLIDPDSAGPFHNQTRKMATWLLDTNRRPDALRAMDQFEQQVGLFYPLPFEAELRSGDPVAVQATGALHDKLIRRIDSTRRDWARAWADGDAGSAEANHLLLLHRLLQTMADTAHLLDLSASPEALNRWACWELSAPAVARAASDLPGRLKLASAAAVDEDLDALEKQLTEIDRDAPVAKLLGRLVQVIGEAARNLPDGAAGTLGQLTQQAQRDAWWLRKRNDLAVLCRYVAEAEFARSSNRKSLQEELTAFINSMADDFLSELGERRSKIPVLIGFDGTDPNPDVEMPDRVRRPPGMR